MNKMIKKLTVCIAVAFMATGCGHRATSKPSTAHSQYNYSHKLQIADQTLMVEIADTSAKMQTGLGGRGSLSGDEGMLFDFHTANGASPAFWMKDMKFNLDFIWSYKNKIVGITNDVPAPSVNCQSSSSARTERDGLIVNCQLPYYYPPSPVDWVLEVNAGWSKAHNVKVGDAVELK